MDQDQKRAIFEEQMLTVVSFYTVLPGPRLKKVEIWTGGRLVSPQAQLRYYEALIMLQVSKV